MGDVLSVRLDDNLNQIIEKHVQESYLEKSEAIRDLIIKGIYMTAVQDYLEQKISIQKAASMANMVLSDFIDFLGKLGIGAQLDLEDVLTGFDNLKKLNSREHSRKDTPIL